MSFWKPLLVRIKNAFSDTLDTYESDFEKDYRRMAAMLLRGETDDLGNETDYQKLSDGELAAISDMKDITRHFIKIGREREKQRILKELNKKITSGG